MYNGVNSVRLIVNTINKLVSTYAAFSAVSKFNFDLLCWADLDFRTDTVIVSG